MKWAETDYDDAAVKDICYHCNSPVAKQSYNYFRRLTFVAGDKVWSKVWYNEGQPVAFYYANRCRDHVRLIEIAVRSEYQGQGYGRKILNRLLAQMKEAGIDTLTFRTPIHEPAHEFWQHLGAQITDIKGSDYEMELKIKL